MKYLILLLPLLLLGLEPNTGEIIIGVVAPFSGPHQAAGEYLLDGMELAAGYINSFNLSDLPFSRSEGLEEFNYYKIKIYAEDDANDPSTARQAVYDLVDLNEAVIIVGSITSDMSEIVQQAATEMGVPYICPVTPDIETEDLEWTFKLTPQSTLMYGTLFEFLGYIDEEYRIRNLALLSIDDAWGRKAGKTIERLSNDAGYTLDAKIDYYVPETYDEIDLTSQLTQLAPYPNSILIQSSYRPGVKSLFHEKERVTLSPQAIIGNYGGYADPYLINAFGDEAEGLIVLDLFAPDAGWSNFIIREIAQAYEDSTDMQMHTTAALGFTAVYVAADAVNRAKSVASADIRDALLETNFKSDQIIMPWDGVRFDPKTHDNIYAKAVVSQVQEGRFRTVWPRELSKIEPSWKTSR